jgi:hypothetical protein
MAGFCQKISFTIDDIAEVLCLPIMYDFLHPVWDSLLLQE